MKYVPFIAGVLAIGMIQHQAQIIVTSGPPVLGPKVTMLKSGLPGPIAVLRLAQEFYDAGDKDAAFCLETLEFSMSDGDVTNLVKLVRPYSRHLWDEMIKRANGK